MISDPGVVAFIGSGKMGEILASGMVRAGTRRSEQIVLSDADPRRLADVAQRHGFSRAGSNRAAVQGAGVVVIAVKPKDVASVLLEISEILTSEQLVLSIAAGVTTASIESKVKGSVRVVRAMPNVAAKVGQGITALCAGTRAGEHEMQVAREILEAAGPVVTVEEAQVDAVTAVSGSGPAYFALICEALIDAGVTVGLSRDLAAQLAAQTLKGTAALVTEAQMTAVEVREAVTSPGGTTAAAVGQLERAGVRAAVLNAVQAAVDRAVSMAEGKKGS